MPADASRPVDDPLASLAEGECGFVLGAALLAAPAAVTERLADDEAARCRPGLEAIAALPPDRRAIRLAALRAAALAPIPNGIADVHPHWLRPALMAESSATLRAAVAGLPAPVVETAEAIIAARGDGAGSDGGDSVDEDGDADAVRELRRAIFGQFVAAGPSGAGAVGVTGDLG